MHSEGISSVIVICVSTAPWFPTSAPPSPPTSETRQKVCHHNFLFISAVIIDEASSVHQILPVITPLSPGHDAAEGGGDPLVAAVVNGLTSPGKLLDSLPSAALQLKTNNEMISSNENLLALWGI